MRLIALVLGALSASAAGVSGAPRFIPRPAAFVSPSACSNAGTSEVPRLVSPLSRVGAPAAAAATDTKSPRCYAYPLTFGGGPRGGGEGEGRVALVTGGSRGIGLAIAKTFATAGVQTVICVAKDQAACDAAAETIRALGAESEGYGVDVRDRASVESLCLSLIDKYKHIDILVNNAGITRDGLFLRMKPEDWSDVIDTNLNSAFYFTSPIIKQMSKQKFGRVVNMSSVVGVGGNAGQANYAASKAGLIGLTKTLAKEFGSRNVTVNAVAPGFIQTQMTDAMRPEAKAAAIASIPAGRMGTPQEVADLIAFLSSDQAGYINGKVIPIDGGMLFGAN